MKRRLFNLVTCIALAVGACDRAPSQPASPASAPTTRPVEIPAADVLTLATTGDMNAAAAAESDPAIRKAITAHLGGKAPQWKIVAARSVGDYMLLWIAFLEEADGGVDLVYSIKQQRINWRFKGGVRG